MNTHAQDLDYAGPLRYAYLLHLLGLTASR
jgi:hypothetical protein